MNTPSPTPSHVVVVGSFNVDHVWRCDALPVALIGMNQASMPQT